VSVEALLVRMGPGELREFTTTEELRERLDEVRFGGDVPGSGLGAVHSDRFVFLDEWSATLLSPGLGDPDDPLIRVVREGTEVSQLEYGHGPVSFHPPDVVRALSAELDRLDVDACFDDLPDGTPRAPEQWITDGRWGYPTDADGVRQRAAELLEIVRRLYRDAAAHDEGMLIAVV
jgi:hypothetical protein